jgi:transcription antitermination protein NusB
MGDPQDRSRSEAERTYTRRARHLSRPKRDDTDDPRRSRERALKILFQADLRGVRATELLLLVSRDAEARAMLDEVDELDGGLASPGAGGGAVSSSDHSAAAASAGAPSAAGDVGARDVGAGGSVGETEAQRIWREERERAELGGHAGEPASEASDVVETTAGGAPTGEEGVAPVDGFTRALVEGVAGNAAQIDELIARFARRWTINRMPVVDRTVLRLATYELLREPTAPAVVINEAVELAKALSTDDSGRYVNGVLDSIRKDIAARREGASQDA